MNRKTSVPPLNCLCSLLFNCVDEDMNITQELASLHSMHGTVTGEDIFYELQKTVADYNLNWTNLSCLTGRWRKEHEGHKERFGRTSEAGVQ